MFALQLKKWRNFNNLFDDPGLNGGVDQEGCSTISAADGRKSPPVGSARGVGAS